MVWSSTRSRAKDYLLVEPSVSAYARRPHRDQHYALGAGTSGVDAAGGDCTGIGRSALGMPDARRSFEDGILSLGHYLGRRHMAAACKAGESQRCTHDVPLGDILLETCGMIVIDFL